MICTDFLVFARGLDHVLRKHDCSCREHHKRAEKENTVVAIPIVIVFLETPVRCIPLTFITE
jgi:hypothetical protein